MSGCDKMLRMTRGVLICREDGRDLLLRSVTPDLNPGPLNTKNIKKSNAITIMPLRMNKETELEKEHTKKEELTNSMWLII